MGVEYERLCHVCENKATWYCDDCKGTGYETTDDGENLLTFLWRHGFVQARERR